MNLSIDILKNINIDYQKCFYEIPLCADQGFFCGRLFEFSSLHIYVLILLRNILTIFVLYLSFFKMNDEPFKRFTLNLYLACLPCDVGYTVENILFIYDMLVADPLFMEKLNICAQVVQYFIQLVDYEYCILSLFFIIAFCLPLATPLFYRRHLHGRTYTECFITIHICAVLLCIPFIIGDLLVDESIGNLENINKSNVVQQVITYDAVTTIALTTVFIIVISFAFYALKHCTGKTASKVAQKNQKKILASFILYCIPLSILNLSSTVSCTLTLISRHSNGVKEVLLISRGIEEWTIQYRTVIISLSTLFALPSYRKAMLRALHLKKTTAKIVTIEMKATGQSTIYPVMSSRIASAKYIQ